MRKNTTGRTKDGCQLIVTLETGAPLSQRLAGFVFGNA
jgi:hypothetical protein